MPTIRLSSPFIFFSASFFFPFRNEKQLARTHPLTKRTDEKLSHRKKWSVVVKKFSSPKISGASISGVIASRFPFLFVYGIFTSMPKVLIITRRTVLTRIECVRNPTRVVWYASTRNITAAHPGSTYWGREPHTLKLGWKCARRFFRPDTSIPHINVRF